jgi:hypothetical protein
LYKNNKIETHLTQHSISLSISLSVLIILQEGRN